MSGRWFTLTIVAVCVTLVLLALWQRSRDTSRIRQFWGPAAAKIIQRAPTVGLRVAKRTGISDAPSLEDPSDWRDISKAPGLVHLRATLIDDRYFHWPARAASDGERSASDPSYRVVRFSSPDGFVDVAIDVEQGTVVHLAAGRAVEIIPASRDAIAAYLRLQVE